MVLYKSVPLLVGILGECQAFDNAFQRSPGDLARETNPRHSSQHRRSGNMLRFIVNFNDLSEPAMEDFKVNFEEFTINRYEDSKFVILEIPEAIHEDVLMDIKQKTYVSVVDHELTVKPHSLYWNKDRIGARNREDMVGGNTDYLGNGYGTYIYVVDSGIDDHIEFGNRIDRGASRFFENRQDSYDCLGHGTKVAGVAAGQNVGVAKAATLISYAILDCNSRSTGSTVILEALQNILDDVKANKRKRVVVNLSLGPTESSEPATGILDIEKDMIDEGIVIIRAAGNNHEDACEYGQAGMIHSLSVGSINIGDKLADHSNYGPCVDILAPGEDVSFPLYSKNSDSSRAYGMGTGTSFAAPLVSGVAALLMRHHWIRGNDVLQAILSNATTIDINDNFNTPNKLLFFEKVPSIVTVPSNQTEKAWYDETSSHGFIGDVLHTLENTTVSDCIETTMAEAGAGFNYDPKLTNCTVYKNDVKGELDNGYTRVFEYKDRQTRSFRYSRNILQGLNLHCKDENGKTLKYSNSTVASITECAVKADSEGANSFDYEGYSGGCYTRHCDLVYSEKTDETRDSSHPGSWFTYTTLRGVPRMKNGFQLQNINGTSDKMLNCSYGGNKYLIENVLTFEGCVDRAEYSSASGINYNVATAACELLSCPVPFDKIAVTSDNWVNYIYFTAENIRVTEDNYRFVPTGRGRILVEPLCERIDEDTRVTAMNVSACSVLAKAKNANAFEFSLDYQCRFFECSSNTFNDGNAKVDFANYFLTYVAEDVLPVDYKGFSLAGSAKKLECDSFHSIANATVEDCAIYSNIVDGNAFNYNKEANICEPVRCATLVSSYSITEETRSENKDYLIGTEQFNGALEECRWKCDADPKCLVFNYNNKGSYCYLNYYIGATKAHTNYTRYTKNIEATGSSDEWLIYANMQSTESTEKTTVLVTLKSQSDLDAFEGQHSTAEVQTIYMSGVPVYQALLECDSLNTITEIRNNGNVLAVERFIEGDRLVVEMFDDAEVKPTQPLEKFMEQKIKGRSSYKKGAIFDIEEEYMAPKSIFSKGSMKSFNSKSFSNIFKSFSEQSGSFGHHGHAGYDVKNGGSKKKKYTSYVGVQHNEGKSGYSNIFGGVSYDSVFGQQSFNLLNGAFGWADMNGIYGHDQANEMYGHADMNGIYGHADMNGIYGWADMNGIYGWADMNGIYGTIGEKYNAWAYGDLLKTYGYLNPQTASGWADMNGIYGWADMNGIYERHGDWATGSVYSDYGYVNSHVDLGHADMNGIYGHADMNGIYGWADMNGIYGWADMNGIYGWADMNGIYGWADMNGIYGHADMNGIYGWADMNGIYGLFGSIDAVGVYGFAELQSMYSMNDVFGDYGWADMNGIYGWADMNGIYGWADMNGIYHNNNYGPTDNNGTYGTINKYGDFGFLNLYGDYGDRGYPGLNGKFVYRDINGPAELGTSSTSGDTMDNRFDSAIEKLYENEITQESSAPVLSGMFGGFHQKEIDTRYWTFAADAVATIAEQPVKEIKYSSTVNGPDKTFNLVPISELNQTLSCSGPSEVHSNVLDLQQCLVKTKSKGFNGVSYSHSSKLCHLVTCQNGFYKTKGSVWGFISYTRLGIYPSQIGGYTALPFNKIGRLGCKKSVKESTTFNGIVSVDACIASRGVGWTEPVVNFHVDSGACEYLSCSEEGYEWKYTNENDVLVYAEFPTVHPEKIHLPSLGSNDVFAKFKSILAHKGKISKPAVVNLETKAVSIPQHRWSAFISGEQKGHFDCSSLLKFETYETNPEAIAHKCKTKCESVDNCHGFNAHIQHFQHQDRSKCYLKSCVDDIRRYHLSDFSPYQVYELERNQGRASYDVWAFGDGEITIFEKNEDPNASSEVRNVSVTAGMNTIHVTGPRTIISVHIESGDAIFYHESDIKIVTQKPSPKRLSILQGNITGAFQREYNYVRVKEGEGETGWVTKDELLDENKNIGIITFDIFAPCVTKMNVQLETLVNASDASVYVYVGQTADTYAKSGERTTVSLLPFHTNIWTWWEAAKTFTLQPGFTKIWVVQRYPNLLIRNIKLVNTEAFFLRPKQDPIAAVPTLNYNSQFVLESDLFGSLAARNNPDEGNKMEFVSAKESPNESYPLTIIPLTQGEETHCVKWGEEFLVANTAGQTTYYATKTNNQMTFTADATLAETMRFQPMIGFKNNDSCVLRGSPAHFVASSANSGEEDSEFGPYGEFVGNVVSEKYLQFGPGSEAQMIFIR